MKKIFFLGPLVALSLASCDQPVQTPRTDATNNREKSTFYDADNTGKNLRDRNGGLPTADNQSERESDRRLAQNIRQAIQDSSSLSVNAKNIKIITEQGEVFLRGPVNSESEKNAIETIVKRVTGMARINNLLEVIQR